MIPRCAGVLLHPTSLPGAYGIGTIGKAAFDFVDYLFSCGFHLWQVLPLGPTTFGDSPYSALSTFAASPYLVDLEDLQKRYSLPSSLIEPPSKIKKAKRLDFGLLYQWKLPLLKKIARLIIERNDGEFKEAFNRFKKENDYWLSSWATFITLKNHYDVLALKEKVYGMKSIWSYYWPQQLKKQEKAAMQKWQQENALDLQCAMCIQFLFQQQWDALKEYAKSKQISIIGDIPIFCATDSADVWANQNLFLLNASCHQTKLAGVPPDYFSPTGQLWGNPLYRWKNHKKDGFAWWKNRMRRALSLYDYVRIDHFRGLEAFWAVPFGSQNAVNGKWMKSPGKSLLLALKKEFGDLPLIAEDLGIITKEVETLRDDFFLPGMKVMQFGFDTNAFSRGDMTNAFLPHNHTKNSVCYTGTHDNNTTQGYFESNEENDIGLDTNMLIARYAFQKDFSRQEVSRLVAQKKLTHQFVIMALQSHCNFAILPLQDIIGLDRKGQMNIPSTKEGNWLWRLGSMQDLFKKTCLFSPKQLNDLNMLYGRK